jgi:hypothetical protein
LSRGELRAPSIAQACKFRATRRASKSLAAALLPNLFSLAIMLGGDSLFHPPQALARSRRKDLAA